MKKDNFLNFLIFFIIFSIFGCNFDPFENFLITPVITSATLWEHDEAKRYYNEEPKNLLKATKKSLEELNISLISKKDNILITENKKFVIKIRKVKSNIARIEIKFHSDHDKDLVELIFEQIELNSNSIKFNKQGLPVAH